MKLKITITIDVGMVAESGYRRGIKYHVIEESRFASSEFARRVVFDAGRRRKFNIFKRINDCLVRVRLSE